MQQWYGIADDKTEYLINDRLSFQRFLGLTLGSKVPDAKTIWAFREKLVKSGAEKDLFGFFKEQMEKKGIITRSGSIVDASFVEAPKQRNRLKIHEKGYRNHPLTQEQKNSNREKSRIRARVEHVFGHMTQSMGGLIVRSIGICRARCTVGLQNLAYNLSRYKYLRASGGVKAPA